MNGLHILLCVTTLLGLGSARFWQPPRPRCDDVSIEGLVTSLARDLDGDDNGVLWDDLSDVIRVLDLNRDGCVSRFEWMLNVCMKYKFSPVLAKASFPAAVFDSCPLTNDTLQAQSVSIDIFYYSIVAAVLKACDVDNHHAFPMGRMPNGRFPRHAGRGFFGKFGHMGKNIDCACSAARDLCDEDAIVSGMTSCGDRGVCAGKGLLGNRMKALLASNDRDEDGFVTGPEAYLDLTENNYDTNNDDCVTAEEGVNAFVNVWNLSEEFGRGRFAGNATCVFSVSFFQNNTQFSIPDDEFLEVNLAALVAVCAEMDEEEFQANCDCAQLAATCRTDPVMKELHICSDPRLERGVCAGKGELADRLKALLASNDRDGDGFVTGPDAYLDLTENNYDTNNDDCVTAEEGVNAFVNVWNLSEEFGRGRFAGNATCVFSVSFFQNNTQFSIPDDEFLEVNLAALVAVCAEMDEEEFQANCDCAQLVDMCRTDPVMHELHICSDPRLDQM